MLFGMFSIVVLIVILSTLAVLSKATGGTGDMFLNIGTSCNTTEVAKAL